MRLLLDTHAVAWALLEEHKLPARARRAIVEPSSDVFVSSVAPWEMATKFRLGKWPGADVILAQLDEALARARFQPLPISLAHARRAGGLNATHRDPFDRMLAAQSLVEGLILVSGDAAFARFHVSVLWSDTAP